jgi:rare lipoprotein A
VFLILIVSACSTQTGRYSQKHDSTPSRVPSPSELIDAVPRDEPHSRGGNKKTYTVRGKNYNVLPSATNFKQTGIASWYGSKFHGHLTSNGEVYNMYSMSAAHKNLPLPTYVKVTNNSNNKSVIVRVNDRGPFHESRIIDLSYSAAYKLDMLKTGTANVTVEAINTKRHLAQTTQTNITPKPNLVFKNNPPYKNYIQVFATQSMQNAKNTAKQLAQQFNHSVITPYSDGLYRVKLGPFLRNHELEDTLKKLKFRGYPNAFKSKIN